MDELRELARAREALARAQGRMRIAEHELEVSELGQRIAKERMAVALCKSSVDTADADVRVRVIDLYNAKEPLPEQVKVRQMRRVSYDYLEMVEWCKQNMPVALKTTLDESRIKNAAEWLDAENAPIDIDFDPQVMIDRDLSGLLP